MIVILNGARNGGAPGQPGKCKVIDIISHIVSRRLHWRAPKELPHALQRAALVVSSTAIPTIYRSDEPQSHSTNMSQNQIRGGQIITMME